MTITTFFHPLLLLLAWTCRLSSPAAWNVPTNFAWRQTFWPHGYRRQSKRAMGGNHENLDSTQTLVIHHTAIKTRNITLAIEFYSLLGFQVSTKFRAGPALAAWLELGGTKVGCRLELIQVPSYIMQEPEGMKRRAMDLMARQDLLGHNHIALDVSDQIVGNGNLTTWLCALNQTSILSTNRMLRLALAPRQQLIGRGVYELAFLYDADGALVELLNKQTELEQEIKSGWEPWDGSDFQQLE